MLQTSAVDSLLVLRQEIEQSQTWIDFGFMALFLLMGVLLGWLVGYFQGVKEGRKQEIAAAKRYGAGVR